MRDLLTPDAPERLDPAAQPWYPNYVEGFPGTACSDSVNPESYDAWSTAARVAEDRHGYFGPLWTWLSSAC